MDTIDIDGNPTQGGKCIDSRAIILSSCALSTFMHLIIIPIPSLMRNRSIHSPLRPDHARLHLGLRAIHVQSRARRAHRDCVRAGHKMPVALSCPVLGVESGPHAYRCDLCPGPSVW
ncbi:hypothetical protein BDU57DRAFT_522088 [Ampelomyces quisqualis]|uniref:Uncharacterized protein n=1 Tax=Ampelomyces quisqualis TaxID=50730 RepID=A0A6A5QCE6_AMPQU|nr:hypothetical protein BDU57DRAFT_522088 [Ampelomyces quisqualis]